MSRGASAGGWFLTLSTSSMMEQEPAQTFITIHGHLQRLEQRGRRPNKQLSKEDLTFMQRTKERQRQRSS